MEGGRHVSLPRRQDHPTDLLLRAHSGAGRMARAMGGALLAGRLVPHLVQVCVIAHSPSRRLVAATGRGYRAAPAPSSAVRSSRGWNATFEWVRAERRQVPKSARGPTRSVSSPLQGAGLPMEWAKMEADNARHDGTRDHRAAVGSGSSPRRTEVWYRASSRSNAQRRSRCQRAENSAASQGISPQFV